MREKRRLDLLGSRVREHVWMDEATATDRPHSLLLPVTKSDLGSEKASPSHSTGKRGYIVYKDRSGLACRHVVSYRLLDWIFRAGHGLNHRLVEQFGL